MLAADTNVRVQPETAARSPDSAPDWLEIVEPVRLFLAAVQRRLDLQVEHFEPELVSFAQYALASQGKQIRPALLGLSAKAVGTLNDDHVTAAAIIEMVHLATLVHDDVMDDASMRRQRPTLALHCGNSTSILLGDCLFAHALTMAAAFPTTEVCRRVAQATKVVCSGEIIQTERRACFELSREGYLRILRMKTAELFGLSCGLGAFLVHATPQAEALLEDYGMALGTAYQIYDDCVDLLGTEARAGKSLGTDLQNGKPTLPVIIALERASGADRDSLQAMLADWHPAHLDRLLEILGRHHALTEAGSVIQQFCRTAGDCLDSLPPGPARDALARAARYLAQRAQTLTAGGPT